MSVKMDTTPAFDVQGEDGLSGLHEHLREGGESARAKVAVWNKRVELWRSRYGEKPIPAEVFKDHPAADMIVNMLRQSSLFEDEKIEEAAAGVLSLSNASIRRMYLDCRRYSAVALDSVDFSADQLLAYERGSRFAFMAQVSGLLLELRTTTSEEICGLPVENIPGCILARTADVREGGDDE